MSISDRYSSPSTRSHLRLCVGIILALVVRSALAVEAPPQLEATLKNMLAALQSGSLADFVAPGDAGFKSGMNQGMLDGVRSQFAPRLKQGYTSTYLGSLIQGGYTIYLWKLQFKDGLDDRLVTMVVRDGKVGGFFLR
jgi:hypothetical protein